MIATPPIAVGRFVRVALIGLVIAGGWLRFADLDWGLPARYHPDERPASNFVAYWLEGRDVINTYHRPPLMRETTFRVLETYDLLFGLEHDHQQLKLLALRTARRLSAIAGTFIIPVTFEIARRFTGPWGAIAAAAAATFAPITVFQSKYGTPDILLTLLFSLSIWLCFRIVERPRPQLYFWCGTVLMSTVAAKYNGAFVLTAFLVAHGLTIRDGPPGARAWLGRFFSPTAVGLFALGATIAFFIGFPDFFEERRALAAHAAEEVDHLLGRGHAGARYRGWNYYFAFHFVRSLVPAVGWAGVGAIVLGLGYAIARAIRGHTWAAITLAAIVPYYFVIEYIYKIPPSFERYVLPIVPLYFALAVWPLHVAWAWLRERAAALAPAFAIAASAAFLAFPIWECLQLATHFVPDTRGQMRDWMIANLPPGTRVFAPGMAPYYPAMARTKIELVGQTRGGKPRLDFKSRPDYVLTSSLATERWQEPGARDDGAAGIIRRVVRDPNQLVHEIRPGHTSYMFHNPTLTLYSLQPRRRAPDSGERSRRRSRSGLEP